MISQQVAGQLSMFGGMQAYAQQLSYPGQSAMYPGMAPPPPPMAPQMTAFGAMQRPNMGGMYGEQSAMRMAGGAQTAIGMGGAALSIAGGLTGLPLDPFSAAMSAGRLGFGMAGGGVGGVAMGGAMAAGAALPFYAATKAAQVYGGAFMGGMQDQAGLNSTLRNNFQHFGGQGPMGRGFSQTQMGQIGSTISGELRRNPATSAGELNQLIAGGAESGQFTATRDVQQFTQQFRKMLDTLKSVQRELGGSLTEALQFVRGAQQSGIFQSSHQANFAAEIRGAEAVTGMDRQQLIALSAQGSQISRAYGGLGRQGAFGAVRVAQQLGAAVQSGAINQEMLSEATGGLTGSDAIQAFASGTLARSGAFSKRAMGRYGIFAMSNASGTGLDQDMYQRFLSGDISTSDVRGAAQGNVSRMGRARALNNEGRLRGAVMEQGGLAAQIGMMRLAVGDRVMDQDDSTASLVLQRRFKMDRPQAEMMMSLMRNQSRIAEEQQFSSSAAKRQQNVTSDIAENRSVEAFMRHLEHGMADATGVTKVREVGRGFLTRISSLASKAMNDILGIAESSLNQQDRTAVNRLVTGRATAADIERLSMGPIRDPGAQNAAYLGGGILQSGMTPEQIFALRGVQTRGMTQTQAVQEQTRTDMARAGLVTSVADRTSMQRLSANSEATTRDILRAQALASTTNEGGAAMYRYLAQGTTANAADAFMARNGMANPGASIGAAGLREGPSRLLSGAGIGAIGKDIMRIGGSLAMGVPGIIAGMSGMFGGSSVNALLENQDDRNLSFIGRGGHLAADLRGRGADRSAPGGTSNEAAAAEKQAALLRRAGYSEDVIAARLRDRLSTRSGGFRGQGASGEERLTYQMLAGTGERKAFSEEDMAAVSQSELMTSATRRMAGMSGDRNRLGAELSILEREAGGMKDPGQKNALTSMIMQMRHNVEQRGGIGREFASLGMSDRRRREIQNEMTRSGAGIQSLGEAVGGQFGNMLRRQAEVTMGFDVEGAQAAGAASTTYLAGLDTSSEEYRRIARVMGETDEGRAFLASGSSERQFVRDVTGGGRRGTAQARETAMSALTGGTFGQMDFTVRRGKRDVRVRGGANRIMDMLSRGGADSESIQQQLTDQLTGMGISGAEGMVKEFTRMSAGGFDAGEARKLQTMVREGGVGEAAEKSRRAQMERANPLDADRNRLLTSIDRGIQTIVAQGPQQTQPPGESS